MNKQEMAKLLEEQLYCAQTLRQQQVQLLAESNRTPEFKLHYRSNADTAWKRFNEIHEQLTKFLRSEAE